MFFLNVFKYSHFDCVLEKLREREHVQEPDSISYIGHGNFAVHPARRASDAAL